jgi:hypothetical protein
LRDERGRLLRSWKDGRAAHNAVLEDYTDMAEGLLAVYAATFDERWFTAARKLADAVLDHFADPAGGFFDTSDDHEQLITPAQGPPGQRDAVGERDGRDRDAPACGAHRRGEVSRCRRGGRRLVTRVISQYPTAFAQWLIAMELQLNPPWRSP